MGCRAGQPAAAEAVGETIELKAPAGLVRALPDQRHGILDKIGVFVGQQLDAIADRRNGANQVMAQPRGDELDNPQIYGSGHIACLHDRKTAAMPGSAPFFKGAYYPMPRNSVQLQRKFSAPPDSPAPRRGRDLPAGWR